MHFSTPRQLLLAAAATLVSFNFALAQDECVTATAVFNGANGPFTNVGSTTNPAQLWTCAFGDNDVWFAYLASCTGSATATTCGSLIDTVMEVFSGPCGSLVSIGCNDDACGLQSSVGWSATSGTTYFIRVGGFGGVTGSFPLNIACSPALPNTLTTTFANNNGGAVGGGVYFNLTAGATTVNVCRMGINLNEAAGAVGSIDVFTQPTTSIPLTGFVTQLGVSHPVTSAGPGSPTTFTLSVPITIPAGTTVGVGLRANGVSHAYTNGTNAYPVPGNIFSNADLTLNAGEATNVFAVGAPFTPRMVNTTINYSLGAVVCPPPATVVSQGAGCDSSFTSFYEEMAPGAFDLSGGSLLMNNTGSGYVVQFAPALPPVAVGLLSAPTALALTDDSQIAAGTLGLTVGSNGWVALGAGNTNAFTPDVPTLLSNPATAFYSWKDLNPSIVGSGQVKYEESGSDARVTFDGVWSFGGASAADANTIQFSYNAITGNAVIAWGTMATTGTNVLVGYSPGGPSANPGASNVSSFAATPIVTGAIDLLPLSLTSIGTPVQGPAATSFQVTTGNIPASALLHVGIVGLTRPGLPLAIIGAPNCFLNSSLDVLVGPAVLGGPASFTWTALALPSTSPTTFYGFQFNAQGAILGTALNPALGLGALTSNGLKCTVGGI